MAVGAVAVGTGVGSSGGSVRLGLGCVVGSVARAVEVGCTAAGGAIDRSGDRAVCGAVDEQLTSKPAKVTAARRTALWACTSLMTLPLGTVTDSTIRRVAEAQRYGCR